MSAAFDLHSAARALGGDLVGAQILFAPPGHSRQDRSASLHFNPKAPGGFVIHSFAGDDPLPIRDYVKERLGLVSGREARLALSLPLLSQVRTTPSARPRLSPSGRRPVIHADHQLRCISTGAGSSCLMRWLVRQSGFIPPVPSQASGRPPWFALSGTW